MSPTHSSATRRHGLRLSGALWLFVAIAALSSCADTGRTFDEQEPTSQVGSEADQTQETESHDVNGDDRERARAGHGQDNGSDRQESHRGWRNGSRDEADENENERDENEADENDGERDENEADESENEADENED